MENYNQKMRKILSQHMNYYMGIGLTIHQSACEYEKVLYNLEDSKNVYESFYREYLIYIMLYVICM